MSSPQILTVDDSRAVRTIVRREVKPLGAEVLEAQDGVEGLAQLARGKVDLVVLDVTMPRMDGPSMLRHMRQSGDKTPVIMLTSESMESVVNTVLGLGVADYVLKPFKEGALRSKIEAALKHVRARAC